VLLPKHLLVDLAPRFVVEVSTGIELSELSFVAIGPVWEHWKILPVPEVELRRKKVWD
jgi:hypothetical protein